MGFEINDGERLGPALRRIILEGVDTLTLRLTDPPDPLDENTHQIRKTCKKQRAALRLLRPSLQNSAYRRENRRYRDVSRQFAGLRESTVLLRTLDEVLGNSEIELNPDHYEPVRVHLRDNHDTQARLLQQDNTLRDETLNALQQARQQTYSWQITKKSHKLIEKGTGRVYHRGYKALANLPEHPSAEAFHEWRKRVKYLWYHLRILRPVWPQGMNHEIALWDELGDLLGRDHDYADLKTLLYQLPELFEETDDMMSLVYALDAERGKLQQQAFYLGRRLYAQKPDAFVKRHRAYWQLWQGR